MNILPGEEIHLPVELVVRGKKVLECLHILIRRIAVSSGETVGDAEARQPGSIERVAESAVGCKGGQIQAAQVSGLKGELAFVIEPDGTFRPDGNDGFAIF